MPAPAASEGEEGAGECCKHCKDVARLFNELDMILSQMNQRISNVAAKQDRQRK